MGRPRIELTDDQVELIEKLAGLGLTQEQVAHCLPISERTLRRRIREGDEAVMAVYARGRAEDEEDLSSLHRKIARGEVEGVSIAEQRKALQWRLERQHKWAARQEITGKDGESLTPTVVVLPAKDQDVEDVEERED